MTSDQCDVVRELAAGYVLGALDPDEERLVREHLAECPERHDEFMELGKVVPYLAEAVEPIEPPASLKSRVLEAAAADLEARGAGATVAAPGRSAGDGTGPADRPEAALRAAITAFLSRARRGEREGRRERESRSARTSPLTWLAGLAAVVAIVALAGWNVALQQDLGVAREYQRGLAAVLDVAAAPGSQTAILTSEGDGPTGIAAVSEDGQVAIVMRDLAPTTGSEVYEAWVIAGQDAPVPIGHFTVGGNGTAAFATRGAPAATGVTVALTRERGPDATAPTPPIVSQGTATTAGS